MSVVVSAHAAQRYVERIEPVSIEEARARLNAHGPAVLKAVAFGCSTVKVSRDCRLVVRRAVAGLDGAEVVTVLEPGQRVGRNPR